MFDKRSRNAHGSIFVTDPTRLDQLRMTPKFEFSKYSINIFHVVKFMLKM